MEYLSDSEFAKQFADCTLDPSLFTHEGHLRLAWVHIAQYGIDQAIQNIRTQIRAYDRIHGDGTKYHETITVAALHIMHHFIQTSSATNFNDFLQEYPRLRTHFKDILAQHYTFDVINDVRGRTTYLRPDLLAFDSEVY